MNLYRADADTLIGADFHQAPQWYQSNFGSPGQNSGFCSENILVLELASDQSLTFTFLRKVSSEGVWICLSRVAFVTHWMIGLGTRQIIGPCNMWHRLLACKCVMKLFVFYCLYHYSDTYISLWNRQSRLLHCLDKVSACTHSASDSSLILKLENNSVCNALVTCHRVILWKLVWSFLHLFALSWSEVWSRLITAVGWSLSPSTGHQT